MISHLLTYVFVLFDIRGFHGLEICLAVIWTFRPFSEMDATNFIGDGASAIVARGLVQVPTDPRDATRARVRHRIVSSRVVREVASSVIAHRRGHVMIDIRMLSGGSLSVRRNAGLKPGAGLRRLSCAPHGATLLHERVVRASLPRRLNLLEGKLSPYAQLAFFVSVLAQFCRPIIS